MQPGKQEACACILAPHWLGREPWVNSFLLWPWFFLHLVMMKADNIQKTHNTRWTHNLCSGAIRGPSGHLALLGIIGKAAVLLHQRYCLVSPMTLCPICGHTSTTILISRYQMLCHLANSMSSKTAARITLSATPQPIPRTHWTFGESHSHLRSSLSHSCFSPGCLSLFPQSPSSGILKPGSLPHFMTATTKPSKALNLIWKAPCHFSGFDFYLLRSYVREPTTSTIYRRFQRELPTLNRLENDLCLLSGLSKKLWSLLNNTPLHDQMLWLMSPNVTHSPVMLNTADSCPTSQQLLQKPRRIWGPGTLHNK